jgi:hypothetical protein
METLVEIDQGMTASGPTDRFFRKRVRASGIPSYATSAAACLHEITPRA